jgi:hypothetical protein
MAKIVQNWPKAPSKDVNDIKNFCFLHHTSPKYSLEYGPNRFLGKKSAQKNPPHFIGPKMAKIGQNSLKKDVNDIKNFCFSHHTCPKSYLEYDPIIFWPKNQPKKIDTTL